jgi:hypothetical protein
MWEVCIHAHAAGADGVECEDRTKEFCAAGSNQTGETEDFAAAEVERNISRLGLAREVGDS